MNAPEQVTAGPTVEIIPLNAIAPSQTDTQKRRRKRYGKEAMQDLADSIKTTGGVMQPIIVRPHPDPTSLVRFEIVCGERRWTASGLAAFPTVPAIVHQLGDEQVLEMQLVENLQREGVHEMEEAEGYRDLMKLKGMAPEELADRVGKSRRYIFNRLALLKLCPEAVRDFYDGKLNGSVAFQVSRIGDHATQREALKQFARDGDDPVTAREAAQVIRQDYMLALKSAPFDVKVIYFRGGDKGKQIAPPCGDCPKRTGNQPELFADVAEKDVCTDPACFRAKKEASAALRLAEAKAAGKKVITGDAATKIMPHVFSDMVAPSYARADETTWDYSDSGATWKKLLGKHLPEPMLVQRHNGDLVEVFRKSDLHAAAADAGLKKAPTVRQASSGDGHKAQEKAKLEMAVRARILHEVREKKRGHPIEAADLVMIAEELWDGVDHEEAQRIVAMWAAFPPKLADIQHKDIDAFVRGIPKMGAADLTLLILDMVLVRDVVMHGREAKRLHAAADRAKVDVKAIVKELTPAKAAKK